MEAHNLKSAEQERCIPTEWGHSGWDRRELTAKQHVSTVCVNDLSDCEGPTEHLTSGGHCGLTLWTVSNLQDPNSTSSCSQGSQKPKWPLCSRMSAADRYGVWQILDPCGGGGSFPHLSGDELTEERETYPTAVKKKMTSQEDRRTGGQDRVLNRGGNRTRLNFTKLYSKILTWVSLFISWLSYWRWSVGNNVQMLHSKTKTEQTRPLQAIKFTHSRKMNI